MQLNNRIITLHNTLEEKIENYGVYEQSVLKQYRRLIKKYNYILQTKYTLDYVNVATLSRKLVMSTEKMKCKQEFLEQRT